MDFTYKIENYYPSESRLFVVYTPVDTALEPMGGWVCISATMTEAEIHATIIQDAPYGRWDTTQSPVAELLEGSTGQGTKPPPVIYPSPTLEQVRIEHIGTLYAAYNAAIQLPVAYMATTFQADNASQDVLTKCLVADSVPTGFYWLDANNAQVPMTFAQLQGLAGVMLAQGQAAFAKLQAKKTAVRDATTVAAVQAVVW